MTDIEITVTEDGRLRAQRLDTREESPEMPVGFRGLDRDLVQFLERLLAGGYSMWSVNDIRIFGALLYRCLIPDPVDSWLRTLLETRRNNPLRIALGFPPSGTFARMASVPWEYMVAPGKPDIQMATDPDVVLYRRIPGLRGGTYETISRLRLLVVVNDPDESDLGDVQPDRIVAKITEIANRLDFELETVTNLSPSELHQLVKQWKPHAVQLIGHATADAVDGTPGLAMAQGAGYVWVNEVQLAEMLTRRVSPPRLVVMHACEAGRATFDMGIGGLPAGLVTRGVQCVVGMQYRISNEDATAFSAILFDAFARHLTPDRAVQEARWGMSTFGDDLRDPDPRLAGLPTLYLRDVHPLLEVTSADGGPVRE